ncbi:hypothetical protein CASFOL_022823 [Castilleja foliolosa]|uniref:BED-type domain-containing protein n=1 Tax=Castilleja foliolosa TaxID=1961234 RepID=A0ABD3CWV3_9LAMI
MSNTVNDTSSKGKPKDPGWDHCHYVDPKNRQLGIKCNYCDKVTKGGVSRAKEHLVGGYRNVHACKNAPGIVKEELKKLLDAAKTKRILDNAP